MYNITTNSSSTTSFSFPPDQHIALRASFGVLAFLSFSVNGLLVLFYARNRDLLRTYYSMFMLNLAATDMMTGIGLVVTPSFIIGDGRFPVPSGVAGLLFCRIVASFLMVFGFGIVSIFTVTCMAVERWFAVAYPARYKRSFKTKKAIVILLSIWICSAVTVSSSLFQKTLGPNNKCIWMNIIDKNLQRLLAIILFIVRILFPLLVMSISFVDLGVRVRRSPALFKTNDGKAGIRLLRMCVATAVILGICWLPNQISFMLFKFNLTKVDSPSHHFTMILCMSNSCLNPFIYCATNKLFRDRFVKFLCPCTKRSVATLDLDNIDIRLPNAEHSTSTANTSQRNENAFHSLTIGNEIMQELEERKAGVIELV